MKWHSVTKDLTLTTKLFSYTRYIYIKVFDYSIRLFSQKNKI